MQFDGGSSTLRFSDHLRIDGGIAPFDVQPALAGPRAPHPAPYGLPGLVRRQHQRRPAAPACEDEERCLTYHDLELLSDDLAERLEAAIGPGDGREGPVALRMERGVHMVVAMLAVLKAGRAYLPLDPREPKERLAAMVDVAGPVAVLGDPGEALADLPRPEVPRHVQEGRAVRPLRPVPDHQPVYVMFTSGSTGTPKGVVQGSGGLTNRLLWMQRRYELTPADRVLQKTPYIFDVSGWEVFWPLAAGARTVLAPPGAHRDPGLLIELIIRRRLTVCHFVPSLLEELLRWPGAAACTSLRHVMSSGEPLGAGLAGRFLRTLPAALHNLYGPTEAAIDVTHWTVPPMLGRGDRVLIGAPIDNVDLYVTGPDGRPVRPGEPGELLIGGTAVALGYAGRPDLTAERFPASTRGRAYRTGDLVRQVGDSLEYLGRIDDQVKIRGTRIEPREVEHVLEQHPAVGQAVVVPLERGGATVELAAALVASADGPWPVPEDELQGFLADRLPPAYRPRVLRWLDRLPLSRTGKADRGRLRELLQAPSRPTGTGGADGDDVAEAWSQALSLPAASDEHVPFLAAGGHSLAAARLLGILLDRRGARLPFSLLLRDNATLAELRQAVAGAAREPAPATRAAGHTTPLAPSQRRLWLLDRLDPGSTAYTVLGAVRLQGQLDLEALQGAVDDVVARHDLLRARIDEPIPGQPRLRFDRSPSLRVEVIEVLGPLDAAAIEGFLGQALASAVPHDSAPMARAALLRSAAAPDACLALVFNHLVADQRSLDIILADLAARYRERRAGRTDPAGPPAPSFAAYASRQAGETGGPGWAADLAYWRQRLAGAPPELDLPFRRPRPPWPSRRGAGRSRELGLDLSHALDEAARRWSATPAWFFLACVATVLAAWSGRPEVVLGVPSSRRRTGAEQDLVGFLVDTLPIRVSPAAADDFAALVDQVRDRYLEALEHAAPPFDVIVEELGLPTRPGRDPLYQVWVNDLTRAEPAPAFDGLQAELCDPPTISCLTDLAFYLRRGRSGYRLQLVYATDLFDADSAAELLEQCLLVAERATRPARLVPADMSLATAGATGVLPSPGPLPPAGPRVAVVADVLAVASRRADAVAVTGQDTVLRYAELPPLVERVGGALAAVGVAQGDVVAVLAERDPLLPGTLLGIWQAGAVAGLIDASLPPARLETCRRLLEPRLTLTFQPTDGALQVADLVGAGHPGPAAPGRRLPGASHVLFTSGTTGMPAAVVVPHGPLRDFLLWYRTSFGLRPEDRFALLSGPGHDPVLRDLFAPLLTGATLAVPGRDVIGVPDRLLEWLGSEGITVVHATPSVLDLLARVPGSSPLHRLRLVVSAGAELTAGLVRELRRLAPGAVIVNAYGTTETPQIVACQQVDGLPAGAAFGLADGTALPVGGGVAGQQLLVVTPSRQLAGIGQRGELAVRGRNLAAGYLDTQARDGSIGGDPWGAEGVRWYRTGDLGHFDHNGRIWFDGRADRQVNVHGYRLELGEVEKAAVAVLGGGQARAELATVAGQPVLELRLVPAPGMQVDTASLHHALRNLLPAPAVPQLIVADPGTGGTSAPPHPVGHPPVTAPGPLAGQLARLLADAVGREVGPDENFFDAGLISLSLLQVHAAFCAASGRELPITIWFACPNLRSMSRYLADGDGGAPAPAAPDARRLAGRRLQEAGRHRREVRESLRADEEAR